MTEGLNVEYETLAPPSYMASLPEVADLFDDPDELHYVQAKQQQFSSFQVLRARPYQKRRNPNHSELRSALMMMPV